jgi:hypothetical protein
LGEFGGQRDATAYSSMRTVGYLQYDFFSPEKGYLFPWHHAGQTEDSGGGRGF